MKKTSGAKKKTVIKIIKPKKLSKQEQRVYDVLMTAKGKAVDVTTLYMAAKNTTAKQVARLARRKHQQHVGVLAARINAKRAKYIIRPGRRGSGTYSMKRR